MIAGLLLRPHRHASEPGTRFGLLDFFLLVMWWLYVYVSFVVCWQYLSPNEPMYNRNFDVLSGAETLILAGILLLFARETTGPWKKFYMGFFGAVVFNGIAFYALNRAIEKDVYFTGSWYDIPYSASFAVFTAVAFLGRELTPSSSGKGNDTYGVVMANLAMLAVLSLPMIALYAMFDPAIPPAASSFRVTVTLATVFLMAFVLFIQHRRLNRELWRTNEVLEEASLTDPLTGLRNRRYFSATIEGDVGQALRSHTDAHDPHTRDLVFYLIDADNFKEVNDAYGHDIGDKVLIEMARRLSSSHPALRCSGALGWRRISDRLPIYRPRGGRVAGAAGFIRHCGHAVQYWRCHQADVPYVLAGLGCISVVSTKPASAELRRGPRAGRPGFESRQAVGQESRRRNARRERKTSGDHSRWSPLDELAG